MYYLPFIEHSQLPLFYTTLHNATKQGRIIPIATHAGSGIRRVLTEWVEQHAWCGQGATIWTSLAKPANSSKRRDTLASSVARQLFSKARYSLRLRAEQQSEWHHVYLREPGAVYADERFTEVQQSVRGLLYVHGVRVWIIYNAQYLDANALAHIAEVWKETNQQFALVLVYKLQSGESSASISRTYLCHVPDFQTYSTPPLPLYRIGSDEHRAVRKAARATNEEAPVADDTVIEDDWFTILDTILLSLNISLADDDMVVLDELKTWLNDYSRGDWDRIVVATTALDETVGTHGQTKQQLTRDVLQRVQQRLTPAHELANQ